MTENDQKIDPEFASEYLHIKSDLKLVVIGNVVFLALLVGLYFANQKYAILNYLEKLF